MQDTSRTTSKSKNQDKQNERRRLATATVTKFDADATNVRPAAARQKAGVKRRILNSQEKRKGEKGT